jgi:hypothetical protein
MDTATAYTFQHVIDVAGNTAIIAARFGLGWTVGVTALRRHGINVEGIIGLSPSISPSAAV